MSDKEYFEMLWKESVKGYCGCGATMVFVIIAIVLTFSSCATRTKIEYVDREVVKYETKIQHDTLVKEVHDSVFHSIIQKGDTIYDTKYIEHIKYRDKIVVKIDTCYKDSIQTQIKENTVEKKIIPKWCYFSLVICSLIIIFAILKVLEWLRTRK